MHSLSHTHSKAKVNTCPLYLDVQQCGFAGWSTILEKDKQERVDLLIWISNILRTFFASLESSVLRCYDDVDDEVHELFIFTTIFTLFFLNVYITQQ